jgi:signal transduction histidine kinase
MRRPEAEATIHGMADAGPVDTVSVALDRAIERARRILASPDGPIAAALVLAFAALLQVVLTETEGDGPSAILIALLGTLPVALVRRNVLVAAWLVTIGTVLALSAPVSLTVGGVVAQLAVSYLAASSRGRVASVLLALPFLIGVAAPEPGQRTAAALLLVAVVAAQVLGDGRRERGETIAELDATRLAMADSQREQAAMEERARIARELHDVVAHHVSMIAVQAETARLTTDGMPDEGKRRLEEIGETARGALAEMRRLLGLLRADAGGDAELAPQPGLDQLDELLDAARAAGSPVRLILSGRVVPLPPVIDLTAYRILQESLTNARRHAPGAEVDVELRYETDGLHVAVRDNGPGADEPDGLGLLGMRERAVMVGGTLRVGAAEGGGFAVEGELPVREPGA